MNENKSRREIDVMQIIEFLLKRWWIIVIAVVLCVGAAFAYTRFFVPVKYTSSVELRISGGGGMTSYQQILAGQYQSKDYPYILKSHDTLKIAAAKLNEERGENEELPEYSASALKGMVGYSAVDDSNIFVIRVTGNDPEETRRVAEAVEYAFILRTDKDEPLPNEDVVDKVVEAEVATVSSARTGARVESGLKRNIVLGGAVGLLIGVAVAILLGLGNDVITSEDWILQKYKDEVPLLASIPDTNTNKKKGYYKYKYSYKRYYSSKKNDDES